MEFLRSAGDWRSGGPNEPPGTPPGGPPQQPPRRDDGEGGDDGRTGALTLTADGQLRTCLFSTSETDLRTPLRAGASDDEIAAAARLAVSRKEAGHGMADPSWTYAGRPMSMIGG